MKNLILLSFFGLATIMSCEQLAELTQFEIDYNESVVIPSTTGIDLPVDIITPDIPTNSESQFAGNGTSKDLIEEIVLRQLDLTLTAPSNGDFGFLKSIEIYISAEGLNEERIAWNENVSPTVGNYLELETSNTDLKAYIIKDSFSLRVSTVTDELITADQEIDIRTVLFVDAKVLGL